MGVGRDLRIIGVEGRVGQRLLGSPRRCRLRERLDQRHGEERGGEECGTPDRAVHLIPFTVKTRDFPIAW